MHGRGHVAAEIERHADIGVAEHLADDLRVDPAAQKDGCRGVAQVVARLTPADPISSRTRRRSRSLRFVPSIGRPGGWKRSGLSFGGSAARLLSLVGDGRPAAEPRERFFGA
jgi:hypothetical protein